MIFGNCAKSLLDLVGYKLKGIPTDEYFIFKSFVDIKKTRIILVLFSVGVQDLFVLIPNTYIV